MIYVRKTFVTLFATVFGACLALFAVVLVGAACSDKVTLRFETDGGSYLASVEGTAGESYQAPGEPQKEGYFFDGWYLDPGLTLQSALPDVMPEESRTFYAKYVRCPLLLLDVSDGTLEKTEHYIRPGTNLSEYLGAYVPAREGLSFGGWYLGGEPLGKDAVMTEEDMTLTARYKAAYRVKVFLQAADEADRFQLSESLSYEGSDWEGAYITAEIPAPEHFLFEASLSATGATLAAGENEIGLYFRREERAVYYSAVAPDGSKTEWKDALRFGARASVAAYPDAPEGCGESEFFGWTETLGGTEEKLPGSEFVLGGEDVYLYGCWAKRYPAARGEGILSVADYPGSEETVRAVYEQDGVRTEGRFSRADGGFAAGDHRGKLDGKGYFLPDDSGVYEGASLRAGETDRGVLELDFSEGSAVYRLGGGEVRGSYGYEYDRTENRYTGRYSFTGAARAEDEFYFVLLDSDSFLREGEEKGDYPLYDLESGCFSEKDVLLLDGFGGAVRRLGASEERGSYRGADAEGEWEFVSDAPFRFLLGGRSWSDENGVFDTEPGYLRYRGDMAGTFVSEEGGMLALDGYGLSARYVNGGETRTGAFRKRGNIVTLEGEPPLRLTVRGSRFFATGEEAGAYTGAFGGLVLDGAGGAALYSEDGAAILAEGTYSAEDGAWRFEPAEGEGFLFRLGGGEYTVFSGRLFGEYTSPYYFGTCLSLDGFGGGVFTSLGGHRDEIGVVYFDETFLEIKLPNAQTRTGTVSFEMDWEKREARQIMRVEAGSYRLYADGLREEILFLGGECGATLCGERGGYTYTSDGEVRLSVGGKETALCLSEENGVPVFRIRGRSGEFSGEEGVLVLDGFGGATFGGESYSYTLSDGVAELESDRLLRFFLGEGTYEIKSYLRYGNDFGGEELCLEENGTEAFFRGGEAGSYAKGAEAWYFVSSGKATPFRLFGEKYALYDASAEREYALEGGGTLLLDGCGYAVYTQGETTYRGTAQRTETGAIVFRSGEIGSVSGTLGFEPYDLGYRLLGEEFGEYLSRTGGERLLLLGGGKAQYCFENVRRTGEYVSVGENEYFFEGGGVAFRFRVEQENGQAYFRVYLPALAENAGEYLCGRETLRVDGYRIVLESDGAEQEYRLIRAADGYLVAESGAGERVCFALGEGSFEKTAATARFLPRNAQNFIEA